MCTNKSKFILRTVLKMGTEIRNTGVQYVTICRTHNCLECNGTGSFILIFVIFTVCVNAHLLSGVCVYTPGTCMKFNFC